MSKKVISSIRSVACVVLCGEVSQHMKLNILPANPECHGDMMLIFHLSVVILFSENSLEYYNWNSKLQIPYETSGRQYGKTI